MKKPFGKIVFACGLLVTLAAFSVCAQQENQTEPHEIPLKEFVQSVREKVARNKVDLTKSFLVELEGVLNKDGRLDLKKSRFIKVEGDTAVSDIGRDLINAFSESGLLAALANSEPTKLNITLGQNENRSYAVINSAQPTAEKAATIESGLTVLVKGASSAELRGANKIGEDEKILLDGVKISSEDKIVTIDFDFEKSVIQEMINRRLKANETL